MMPTQCPLRAWGRALSGLLLVAAFPVMAQTPEPDAPDEPKPTFKRRVYFGGGVGAAFGTIDYVAVAPLVGFRVAPRVDLGVQPFYRWTRDGRYSPSVSTDEYGAALFARVHIYKGLFGEADYEYTSYEYVDVAGGTARDTHNGFLAGAGYALPVADNVGIYFSALYDFTYDSNGTYSTYESPVRFQVGVSVGF